MLFEYFIIEKVILQLVFAFFHFFIKGNDWFVAFMYKPDYFSDDFCEENQSEKKNNG